MSKVDEVLKRMISILVINGPFIPRLGLLDGKMGIVILLYYYSRFIKNKNYETFAEEILKLIYEEIDTSIPTSFSSGLLGIGWGIEYLAQNEFVEADTKEVLNDLDISIFQLEKKIPILNRHYDDYYGYGLYYLARTRNGNVPEHKDDMLLLLLNDIYSLLQSDLRDINNISNNFLLSLIYVIQELKYSGLLEKSIEQLLNYFIIKNRLNFDKLICLTDYTKNILIHTYQISSVKIETVKNGINISEFKNKKLKEKCKLKGKYGFRSSDIIILYVGRLGIFELLPAFEKAYQIDSRLRLVLAGDGDFSLFLENNNILGRITITGYITKEKLNNMYQIADIGVLPSFNEQQPFSILEMIRAKIPVITSDIENLRSFLGDHNCIYIPTVEKEGKIICLDQDSFVKSLLFLSNNKKEAKLQSKRAFSYIMEECTINNMRKRMIEIYESMFI